MEINKYISGLLFEHDCVIIPDFGGFVCNYFPAEINVSKSQFRPPFKKISFNRNLKNNDGLLANQISQEEKISFSEANRFIAESVELLNKGLSASKRYELKNIGKFYLGEENTILFQQDLKMNYLPEFFGLSTFYSPAIRRESIERKFEKKLQDKNFIPSKENPETILVKRRAPAMRYVALAASVLIIASLIFGSLKTDFFKNTNFANLNPFTEKEIALYQPINSDALTDVAKNNASNLLALNRNDTTRYLNIIINGNIPIVVSLQDDKTSVVKTETVSHKSNGHFNIIGGAFAIPENADKFLSKLKSLGYDAQIIHRKLRLVSYGKFSTEEEALEAMEKIRLVQVDAWLMTN